MAVKHVKEEYDRICKDYAEMVATLNEMEEEGVPKEQVSQVEAIVKQQKENWLRWNYMMFLLYKPVKKKKQARYEKQEAKRLNDLKSESDISRDTISQLKNLDTTLKEC